MPVQRIFVVRAEKELFRMNNALVVVDFVNDFVETNGRLTCGEPAQKIDAYLAETIRSFAKRGGFVVVANDCHTDNDAYNPEHNLFPSHCVKGTHGAQVYGQTNEAIQDVKPEQRVLIEKNRYSAFAGTALDMKLRERKVGAVYLAGVCSDICVLHTAVDAYNLGYSLFIYEKAIASFNSEGHAFALNHFKNTLGATIL